MQLTPSHAGGIGDGYRNAGHDKLCKPRAHPLKTEATQFAAAISGASTCEHQE